jgi:hypothetical protein
MYIRIYMVIQSTMAKLYEVAFGIIWRRKYDQTFGRFDIVLVLREFQAFILNYV